MSGSQKLFSAETSDSRKYDSVRRLAKHDVVVIDDSPIKSEEKDDDTAVVIPDSPAPAALLSFRLCCLKRDQRFDLITTRSAVVGGWEESPIHLIDGNEKRICRLSFEF